MTDDVDNDSQPEFPRDEELIPELDDSQTHEPTGPNPDANASRSDDSSGEDSSPAFELTQKDAATSSTDSNRLSLGADYEAESYGLQNETSSDAEPPGWQQVHGVDVARPDDSDQAAAKKRRKSKRKSHDLTVLIGCNAVVFFSSICVMVLEVVASRLIAKHVGNSLYTWTSVIGVVLSGITIGNFLGGWMADRFKPEKLVGRLFFAASVACLSVLWLDQLVGTSERPVGVDWPTWVFCIMAQLFFLPALALGTISPVVASIALGRSKRTGITVGNVYAWGAMGSIIGTFLTGFYLIDVFGTRAIIGGTSAALAILGALCAARQFFLRVWILFGWLQFLAIVTLAASSTSESFGEVTESMAHFFVSRDSTLVEAQKWHVSSEPVLSSDVCSQLAKMSRADALDGLNETDRKRLERWTKTGRRDRFDHQIENAFALMFTELDEADLQATRWKEHGAMLGNTLHELGILLFLRGDALGEYHDESNYSYINVSDTTDEITGDQVKQLRLDKLAHSYINLAEPTKLYYEYESIYAEITDRVSASRTAAATLTISPDIDLTGIQPNLPSWAKFDDQTRKLTVTGALTKSRREELLKTSEFGDYWLALEELSAATQDTYWGGFSSASLKSIPSGASNSALLKEKMSFDVDFEILNAFQELKDQDVDRLAAIGAAKTAAPWRLVVNQLYQQSRSVNTFFIGGGGFVFPRWIEHYYPHQSRIDVAEIDPAVLTAVEREMGLPPRNLTKVNTIIGDARNVVDDRLLANKRLPKGQSPVNYDFIYGDAFNDLSVPWHLTTREFNQKVKALLEPKRGVYLINVIDIWPRAEFPVTKDEDGNDAGGLIEEAGEYRIAVFESDLPAAWKVEYQPDEEWQSLADQSLCGAEALARDDGRCRIGFRGLMTHQMRKRLVKLAPSNKKYVDAIGSLFRQSQSEGRAGRFLSSCVDTLAQDFANIYVFSTQHGPPAGERDTFVVAASLAPIDFKQIEQTNSHWDTAPFAVYLKSSDNVRKTGQMPALLTTAADLVLTDDFAPVDRLLRPVFVDQE